MLSNLVKIKKKRKIVGRNGGRGGSSGKGNKGQKARSGGFVKAQFEGGQTPLTRRLPKRGFNNKRFEINYEIVTLTDLQNISEKFSTNNIDKVTFKLAGVLKRKNNMIKILCNGKIEKSINISVNACSEGAKRAIENAGGTVNIVLSN